jgi:hypothetical protein
VAAVVSQDEERPEHGALRCPVQRPHEPAVEARQALNSVLSELINTKCGWARKASINVGFVSWLCFQHTHILMKLFLLL